MPLRPGGHELPGRPDVLQGSTATRAAGADSGEASGFRDEASDGVKTLGHDRAVGRRDERRWGDRCLGRWERATAGTGARVDKQPCRVRTADRRAGSTVRPLLGASCALGAARHLPDLRAVVLYEPSHGVRFPPGSIDRMESRLEAGDHEGVLIELLTEVVGLPENEIGALRAAADWPERVAYAPTSAREARISDGWEWRPGGFGRAGPSSEASSPPGRRPLGVHTAAKYSSM
jgi:hypothetical protein